MPDSDTGHVGISSWPEDCCGGLLSSFMPLYLCSGFLLFGRCFSNLAVTVCPLGCVPSLAPRHQEQCASLFCWPHAYDLHVAGDRFRASMRPLQLPYLYQEPTRSHCLPIPRTTTSLRRQLQISLCHSTALRLAGAARRCSARELQQVLLCPRCKDCAVVFPRVCVFDGQEVWMGSAKWLPGDRLGVSSGSTSW